MTIEIAPPNRWQPGEVLSKLDGITPLLATWDRGDHPSQVRMKTYLDALRNGLGWDSFDSEMLFLDLTIDVGVPARLLRDYDLENFLTPVASAFGGRRLVLAIASKVVGGGSSIRIGRAVAAAEPLAGWSFACAAPGAGTSESPWKARLREQLIESGVQVAPPGPVAVELAWRCAPARNWVQLWKPTGDSMGPVLGEPNTSRPFSPADDRITSLKLHKDDDVRMGHSVEVGLWWREALN